MDSFEHLCMNCMADMGDSTVCPVCGFHPEEPQMAGALPYGTVLQDRYIVGRARRCNGEGISYIGYDKKLQLRIELRELFPQTICERAENKIDIRVLGGSEIVFNECLSKFLSYSRDVAHLRELSAIEQIYDIFEENHTVYRAAEWSECITLRHFVERSGGSLSWNDARPLFMPVINALGIVHSAGVSHLGISPDTLVILMDGKMKLSGFCIDTVRRVDADLPPELVPGCAAIEQYVTDYVSGETTDVYGLAASLFFALTGELPPDALKRRSDTRLLVPAATLRLLPQYVVSALAHALQVSPDKRTPTFERLRDELSAAPTVTAVMDPVRPQEEYREPAPPVRDRRQERRPRVPGFVWVICSFLVALVIFGAAGFALLSRPQATEEPSGVSSSSAPAVETAGTPESQTSPEDAVRMIEIPDLLGDNYDDLMESSSGNTEYRILVSDKQFDDTVPEGHIISQDPMPGGRMEEGSAITVIVSLGARTRTLPDITGLDLTDASRSVTAEGFLPVLEEDYSDTVPEGFMIGYRDHEAGDELDYGTQVTILRSLGPETGESGSSAEFSEESSQTSQGNFLFP